jgi:pimeloyl-ACP methyl ester carboxylesterase
VDGVKLLDLIVAYEFIDPDYAGVLSAIHAARKGDRNPLLGLEANVHQGSGRADRVLQRGPPCGHAVLRPAFPWGTATTNRQAFITGRLVTLPAQATWPFTPATAAGNGIIATCKNWPETPAPPLLATRLPAVPVLLLSGERDLSTPNEWARQEAALAPKGKLVIVPGASHSIQTRERGDVGRRALQQFLLG